MDYNVVGILNFLRIYDRTLLPKNHMKYPSNCYRRWHV